MKKYSYLLLISTLILASSCASNKTSGPVYLNPNAPVEKRIADLLGRMTLEEKVGQMNQFVGIEHVRKTEALKRSGNDLNADAYSFYKDFTVDSIVNWTSRGWIGSFLHVYTKEEAEYLQKLAMGSRLGIPLIFGIDAVHGNANCLDNTVYPDALALASTFNVDLAREIARQTALEMRSMNMHWTFAPGVDISRDPRWGRCGETFGEDPLLVSEMAVASIEGYTSGTTLEKVLTCAKHLVGGGQSLNGANSAPSEIPEITLQEVFLPPFRRAVEAGVGTIMPAHNDINGVPCHANAHLLQNVVRKEWGFNGFYVSDWMDIERLALKHQVASDRKDAYRIAIESGLDLHMQGIGWTEDVCQLVREGLVSERRIDESVSRILKTKFELGLFEHPYAMDADSVRLCEEHRATSLKAARQGIVLLKNDGILPLDSLKKLRIMVSGINADSFNILGDWTYPQRRENYMTALEGLRSIKSNAKFEFVDVGLIPDDVTPEKISAAATKARSCDMSILVVGDFMFRDIKGRTCGENCDRADVGLPGRQKELVKAVAAAGKPVVLVLCSGRPLAVFEEDKLSNAVIEIWEPGMSGGQALAEIIFGRVNPSGHLAMTMPRHSGGSLMFYSRKPMHDFHPYVDYDSSPLYPFGFGLSYSEFRYSKPTLSSEVIKKGEKVVVSVEVSNISKKDGDDVIQLYVHDELASITRPLKELKGFQRVHIPAGQSRTVSFEIDENDLSFIGADLKRRVEPGFFKIFVGPDSDTDNYTRLQLRTKSRR